MVICRHGNEISQGSRFRGGGRVSKYDEKQKNWSLAYQRSLKSFTIKMKVEDLERYKDMAERKGIPFRQFVMRAMEEFGAEEE